jgi:hypothetical protein
MASLTGSSIASSYTSLLKLNGNTDNIVAGNGSNAIQIVDGDGTASPLYLNTDRLGIGGQPHVNSTLNVKNSSGTAFLYISSATDADSAIVLEENTSAKWIIGNDGNDSDNLKFGTGGGWATETKMTLTSGGSLGVGTASPQKLVHLDASSGYAEMRLSGSSGGGTIEYYNDSTALGDMYFDTNKRFYVRTGGATTALTIDENQNATIAGVATHSTTSHFVGNVGIGSLSGSAGGKLLFVDAVDGLADGTDVARFRNQEATAGRNYGVTIIAGSNSTDNSLNVMDKDSNSSFIVKGDGSVGIGSDSPSRQLHIKRDTSDTTPMVLIEEDGTGDPTLQFLTTGASDWTIGIDNSESDEFAIAYGSALGSTTKRFVLDANSRISLSNNDGGATGGTDSTSGNTVFGYLCGTSLDTDTVNNTLYGHKSGTAIDSGDENTAYGNSSLDAVTNGSRNTAVGHGALGTHATIYDCVGIGKDSEVSANAASNQIVIGKGATGQADNSVTLGNGDVTRVYMSQDGDAEMYANGTINTSDKRLKEDISNSDLGLSFINKLRPVSYKFKNDKKPEKLKYGIIAQEVQEVLKESGNEDFAGITDKGEYLGADYVQFIAPLIKAVQELSEKVAELENK